jgi:hypothetical protein
LLGPPQEHFATEDIGIHGSGSLNQDTAGQVELGDDVHD